VSLFVIGEQGFGATRSPVLAGVRLDGLAAQLFHALADRSGIIGGAGSGHIASLHRADASAVQPDGARLD
jgi:hypothetical protein